DSQAGVLLSGLHPDRVDLRFGGGRDRDRRAHSADILFVVNLERGARAPPHPQPDLSDPRLHGRRVAPRNRGRGWLGTPTGTGEHPEAIAATLLYPCIIRPLDLSGSQGVIRADDATVFPSVFRRVATIVKSCAPNGGPRSLLVEDFITGDEVAVEALLRRGGLEVLAIFDKPDPLNGPFFEETIYVTP